MIVKESNIINLRQSLAYAAPTAAVYFLFGPIFILQGIYAKYYGLTLTTIASVIFLANIFDAVTDPLIGNFSDRYYRKTGSRKPFIIIGGLLCIVTSYFLYVPPEYVTGWMFFGFYIAYYLSLKLFDIPHLAWPSKLTESPKVRNKLYGLRSFMMFFGGLLYFSVPQLPIFETTEFTPETLEISVAIGALLLLPALYMCVRGVPDKHLPITNKANGYQINSSSILKIIFSNKPLIILLVAVLLSGCGLGMWASLSFIYIDAYLELGSQFSIIYVVSLATNMLALGVWYKSANRFGNVATWLAGIVLIVIGIFCMQLLIPGNTTIGFYQLLLVMILINIGIASNNIMIPSLLSGVIDYGRWKFRVDFGGTYFSILTMTTKINLAIANMVALGVAGWYGFNPGSDNYTAENIFGLHLAITWIPSVLIVFSIIIILMIPTNSRRQEIILKRLNRRHLSDNKYDLDKSRLSAST